MQKIIKQISWLLFLILTSIEPASSEQYPKRHFSLIRDFFKAFASAEHGQVTPMAAFFAAHWYESLVLVSPMTVHQLYFSATCQEIINFVFPEVDTVIQSSIWITLKFIPNMISKCCVLTAWQSILFPHCSPPPGSSAGEHHGPDERPAAQPQCVGVVLHVNLCHTQQTQQRRKQKQRPHVDHCLENTQPHWPFLFWLQSDVTQLSKVCRW